MDRIKRKLDEELQWIGFTEEMKGKVWLRIADREHKRGLPFWFRKPAVSAAGLFLLAALSVTVAAKVLLWDVFVANKYGILDNREVQEKAIADKMAAFTEASDTDNGITVSVLQTVSAGGYLDIYLKIQPENEEMARQLVRKMPNVQVSFEKSVMGSSEGKMETWYTEGEGKPEQTGAEMPVENVEYEIYNISMSMYEDHLDGDTISLTIRNFEDFADRSTVLEGDWNLSWKISSSGEKRTIAFADDYEIEVYGKKVILQKVELTRTGWKVYLDRDSLDRQGLVWADVYLVKKENWTDLVFFGKSSSAEYEEMEWRGSGGIPLEINKDLSERERNEILREIEEGTYGGEYLDIREWISIDNNHVVTKPWETMLGMKNGKRANLNYSGGMRGEGDSYVLHRSGSTYIELEKAEGIWIDNCYVPFSEGTEEQNYNIE